MADQRTIPERLAEFVRRSEKWGVEFGKLGHEGWNADVMLAAALIELAELLAAHVGASPPQPDAVAGQPGPPKRIDHLSVFERKQKICIYDEENEDAEYTYVDRDQARRLAAVLLEWAGET